MTNQLSSYRFINVTNIIKNNIRLTHIKQDVTALLTVLIPLKHTLDLSDESPLNEDIVRKLKTKPGVLDLLIYLGYQRNNFDEYIYRSPRNDQERKDRENHTKEFRRFFTYLQSTQRGNLEDLEEFLRYPDSNFAGQSDRNSLPDQRTINIGNKKTLETIKSLKESLVTNYNEPPPHSFIRRKIARLLFKQKHPELVHVDDDLVDRQIYEKILSLKEKDEQTNVPRTDHVYIECLIRADLNNKQALNILRDKRPNLELPPEPIVPKETTKTSIDNLKEPLKQHYRLINQPDNKNRLNRQFSRDDDSWEQVKHIIPAIQQIRKTNNTNADETFSKIFRLLNTELSHIVGPQTAVKIEIFSSLLCEISMGNIDNLDVVTIKDILRSNSGSRMHDDFRAYALKCLSVECPICMDTFPRSRMETMFLCSHMCCSGCAKDYYRNNIDQIDTQSIKVLTCFMEQLEITSETHQFFFTCLEAKLNQWFHDEPDLLRRYHDKIFYALRGKQIKKCANSKCVSSFHVDDNDEITNVRCPHCEFAQCSQCGKKWYPEHKGMNCEDYTNWLFENDPDDPDVQAMMYLRKNGIICPNKTCQEIYEYKAGGCEHFTCTKCKTDFCRMCSVLYYFAKKDPKCTIPSCTLKSTIHAHCAPNCFRETRIGRIDVILKLLKDHKIDVAKELAQHPVSKDAICTIEDCKKPVSTISGNRFCESCYQQFLCAFIWNRQIEPWEVYEDNNLEQMLRKASVPIPANATRQQLLELCRKHLNSLLGKPQKMTRSRV